VKEKRDKKVFSRLEMLEGAKLIGARAAIGIGNVFSSLIHSVFYGIARVYGLNEIQAGEMVEFASGTACEFAAP